MNEEKVLDEYKKGEREIGVLLDIISTDKINMGHGGRTRILQDILKGHNIPRIPPLHTNLETKNRQRLFIREYKAGHRDLKHYATFEELSYWSYYNFKNFCRAFNYRDIVFCSKEEFERVRAEEMNKVRMCRWLFNESDEKEYTMEELDAYLERRFLHHNVGVPRDKYDINGWLERFLIRCPNFQGYDEKKLRTVFKRAFNLWDSEVKENTAIIQAFGKRLPIFLKEHNITDFERWHEKDKEDDIKLVLNPEDDIIDSESKEEECLIDPEDEQ